MDWVNLAGACRAMTIKAMLSALCLLGTSDAVLARQAGKPPAARAVDADFRRGAQVARADFAAGRGGWYFFFYSNMPNGPDDPVQVRERDLLIAVLMERGIAPMNNSTGCIPDAGFSRFTQGYNTVADPLLKKKFGSDYMARVKEELARRMKEASPAAGS